MKPLLISALLLCTVGLRAEVVSHEGADFYVYRLDPKKEKLELFLGEAKGKPNTFPIVRDRVAKQGRKLKFAMNSGIFEGTFQPSGLHIAAGKTITKLNLKDFKKTREGEFTPNFFLKPNGVFYLRKDGTPGVLESNKYSKSGEKPILATQSGPLLVENGKIHPVLEPTSTSTRFRNGLGVASDGTVVLVCSVRLDRAGQSNLYHFAELFRDKLDCKNALYLDGDISYVYIEGETPPIRETNWFAGILAITEPVEEPTR